MRKRLLSSEAMRPLQTLHRLGEGVHRHDLEGVERGEVGVDGESFDRVRIVRFDDPKKGMFQRRMIPRFDPTDAVRSGSISEILTNTRAYFGT